MKQTITIKDIARLSGVSIGTIDRYLNNRGKIAPKTEEKIRQIIKETGYKPNPFAGSISRSKAWNFGVIIPIPETDSAFWKAPEKGIDLCAEELSRLGVRIQKFFYDRRNKTSFTEAINDFLKTDNNGLLIAPIFEELTTELLQNYDKPVITFDTKIDNPSRNIKSFIGQNSKQSGRLAAHIISLKLRKNDSVLIIHPKDLNIHNKNRMKGFIEYNEEHNKFKIETLELANLNKELGYDMIFEQYSEKIANCSAIFTADETGWYAGNLWETTFGKEIPIIITYDLTGNNVKALKEDKIFAVIGQRPEMQGYLGIKMLYTALRNPISDLKSEYTLPLDIFTKENVDMHNKNMDLMDLVLY
ncbi:MAG: LacI family DNA-binding transcriptional regulator [Spirochaetales bacterium]|nr:LacI family DNA-binding transcriptional regulator [Spirochaetales bacterium]